MNIIWKLSNYYHLRRKGIKHAWIKSPLLAIDYWLILSCVCIALIAITLYYADFIDNAFTEQKDRVKQAQNDTDKANNKIDQYEKVIVSMLNGRVRIDGLGRTVCLMTAAGDCL